MELLQFDGTKIVLMCREQAGPAWCQPVTYVHLHQDETTSVEATGAILEIFGGRFFRLSSGGQDRLMSFSLANDDRVFVFDPNRIFTPQGRVETLTANGPVTSAALVVLERLAEALQKVLLADQPRVVVAVHNNKGEDYSLRCYQTGGDLALDARIVYVKRDTCPYDFFLTTEAAIFDHLASAGMNVVLQANDPRDDGSLSVCCGQLGVPYINVEARHDHLKEQFSMLRLLNEQILPHLGT